jgi:hypothetical protein
VLLLKTMSLRGAAGVACRGNVAIACYTERLCFRAIATLRSQSHAIQSGHVIVRLPRCARNDMILKRYSLHI